jgi:hypothetical protein
MNAVASSEHRVASRPSRHFYILRALIRNDEALVEHLAAQLEGADGIVDALPTPDGYSDERAALLERLGDVIRRLQLRRARLQALTSPTATASHEESLAGSLVTPTAALPGTPLQHP